jgi:hypothetical protein
MQSLHYFFFVIEGDYVYAAKLSSRAAVYDCKHALLGLLG